VERRFRRCRLPMEPREDRPDECGQLVGQQRGLRVGAGQAPVHREVLLDTDRAARHRGDRYGEARRMVGQPHRNAEALGERVQRAQIGELRRRGIVADTVQKDEVGEPARAQRRHRGLHLLEVRHPGRQDDGESQSAHHLEHGEIGHVARGDLQTLDAEALQVVCAVNVEGRGHELDAAARAVGPQVFVRGGRELQHGQHRMLARRGPERPLLVLRGGRGAGHEAVRGEGLELHGIGAGRRRHVDERAREGEVAVVVDARFRDDEGPPDHRPIIAARSGPFAAPRELSAAEPARRPPWRRARRGR
jgi:hypothetical protein